MKGLFENIIGRNKPKLGLALSGGAVLGAAHIGVLQALDENKIKIDLIAGTSIGAFIGALYAFGRKPGEIEEILTELNWLNVAELSFSRYGLLSNQRLGDLMIQEVGDKELKDAAIPFSAVCADITTGEKIVLNHGSVAQAVMASTSIPGIFQPVEVDGRMLVDGGIVENLPIDTIKEMGADKVLAVNLMTDIQKPDNIIDILINVLHISILNNKNQSDDDADWIIELKLSDFNRVDTDHIPDLIREGYKQGKQLIKTFHL